jgi:acetolactate synthase-1/2/3 large subunit
MQNPDFVKLAEAYGIPARRVEKQDEIEDAYQFAVETPGPVLLDFIVEQEEAVFPMVPAGHDLDDMIRRPIRRKPGTVATD